MAISPTKGAVQACRCEAAASTQLTAECRLRTENGAIAKVLAVYADACVDGHEVLNGEVSFNGTARCRVLYLDGEGVRKVLEGTTDFRDKIVANVVPTDAAILKATVVDTATVKVETDGITLKAMVDVCAVVGTSERVECVTDCGEGVYGKTKKLRCMNFAGSAAAVLNVECEKELDAEGDLLIYEAQAGLTGITARVDGFVAEGTVVVNAVYKATDGQLKNTCFSAPFCEEVACAGLNGDACIDAFVCVKEIKATVTRAEGVPTAVKTTALVGLSGLCYMPVETEVVTDAFRVDAQTVLTTQKFHCGSASSTRVKRNIEGTAELSEGMPACDGILGVTSVRAAVAGAYGADGKTTVEGVLSCAVLYYNKEFGTTNSVAVELPYSVVLDAEAVAATGSATVLDVNAKSLRAGKIDVAAEVLFDLRTTETEEFAVVTDLEEGAESEPDEAGVTVCIAREGMTLWDVAKGLNVAPENVMLANPDLVFPTAGGEKVVLYRKIRIA